MSLTALRAFRVITVAAASLFMFIPVAATLPAASSETSSATKKTAGESAKGPVKIGFLVPLTGVGAPGGEDMVDGMNLYLDKIHHQMAGRKVEFIVEGDGSNAATALQKMSKLLQEDHVQVLSGFVLSNYVVKVLPVAEKAQIPVVVCIAAADDLTQRERSRWVIRTSWAASQQTLPFGEWVYTHLGYKRVVTFGNDINYCWDAVGGFQKTFEQAGGKVVQKIWAPLGFTDFRPAIKQIRKDADAVFVATAIGANNYFSKQYAQAGATLPLIGVGTSFDERVLRQSGDHLVGAVNVCHTADTLPTPANKAFVKEYREKHNGADPGLYAEGGYTTAMWIDKAVEAVQGDIENKEKFLAALKAVELKDSPRGPIKLDEYGNPVENIYVRKVTKVNDRVENDVIFTFPKVSQFWKYNPQEYLKQPSYSQSYPECKYCSP